MAHQCAARKAIPLADVVFVALTVVVFALLALAIRGAERL
jgi:hypothetical protein